MSRHRPFRPRLWPLLRRQGWLAGWRAWWHCRRYGCTWRGYQRGALHAYPLGDWRLPDGRHMYHGLTRMQCDQCRSVRWVRLDVLLLPGGEWYSLHSPDGWIRQEGPWLRLTERRELRHG